MTNLAKCIVTEPDESSAPVVILYILGVLAWLGAIIAWVYYFRGYA